MHARAVLVFDFDAVSAYLRRLDQRTQADIQTLSAIEFQCSRRDLPVGHGEEQVLRLEQRHLGTEAAPDAAKFQADDNIGFFPFGG